ncbi:hypothetical protein [Streptomyces sp. NBC_00083]|uniref:hypothetical protein n=1 Tax=Streptomyces sp. NBC_00083 TaxID=2975647 RepID=UPI00224DCF15|nr:hypothetical protein [Streptomyces sp. NBC_00083]MCX5381718.1 hypothetical protein [Streptomyces sp. NBC_00083]
MNALEGTEAGPAVFAGTVFVLFGGALLLWTASCARRRTPVAHGASPVASAMVAAAFGVGFLLLGVWCFTRIGGTF